MSDFGPRDWTPSAIIWRTIREGRAEFRADLPPSPRALWRALTDREAMGAWLMPNNFEPKVGHKFRFDLGPQFGCAGYVDCVVLEVDGAPSSVLQLGGRRQASSDNDHVDPDACRGGTHLRLEHSGFRGTRGLFLKFILGGGWKKKLAKLLPDVLAKIESARAWGRGRAERLPDRFPVACHSLFLCPIRDSYSQERLTHAFSYAPVLNGPVGCGSFVCSDVVCHRVGTREIWTAAGADGRRTGAGAPAINASSRRVRYGHQVLDAARHPAIVSKGTVKITSVIDGRFLLEESTGTQFGRPIHGLH